MISPSRTKTLAPAVVAMICLWMLLMPRPSYAVDATPVAIWEMNEPAGTTVMTDATGHHDGVVNPVGVTSNGSFYHWQQRCPSCPPTAPERVVVVADNPELDIPDPAVTYTVEFLHRTKGGYGNIMQKGQSGTTGGQIKVQLPQGRPQCLFKGANGVRVGSGSPEAINDGLWHTVKCVHRATQVLTYVDGVLRGGKTVLPDRSTTLSRS